MTPGPTGPQNDPVTEPTHLPDAAPRPDAAADEAGAEATGTDAASAATDERPGWRRHAALFLTGQGVSLFGSMLVQYAIMWHLTLTTKSGTVMTLAVVFGFLPQAVVSIFGGVWADRFNRKALIIAADSTIAATTLALALFMLAGGDNIWAIYATLVIRSIGAGIQTPAVTALVPQLVPTSRLMRINGINATIQSGLMLVAPAAAAALYASFAIEAIFFVDVVTAIIGVGLLALIPVPTIRTGTTGYFADLREGLVYIHRHRFVRWLLGVFAVVMLLVAAPSNLTPLMLVRTFGEEVWKLTALELAFALGMLLGGALLATWGGLKNRVLTIMLATLVLGGLTVLMGFSPWLWIFLALMFLVGLVVPFFGTTATTVLQETVEPERHGRVFGVLGIVIALAMPAGMAIFGPLADRVSVQSLLVVAGSLLVVVAVSILVLPAGRRGMASAEAGGQGAQPGVPDAAPGAEVPSGSREG